VPTRLLRATGVRIALLYLVLLGVTLLALCAFVYWSTAGLIERQAAATIEAEIRGLAEQYRNEGLVRLVAVIQERSGATGDPQSVYLLTDWQFQPLAGNLAGWPQEEPDGEGWLRVRLARQGDSPAEPHSVLGRRFELAGAFHLFVGRDVEEHGLFRRNLVEAFAWAFLPALALGGLGGLLIARYSRRRVEAVRAAAADIVAGDLSRRVPVTGSGDEFDRLATTINEMLERIAQLMGGLRLVTDSLAHDLRSPLGRARNAIELALAREGGEAADYRQALEQTAVELQTILGTFEALIDIAQAESGADRVPRESVDLSSLATDLSELYQAAAESAGLSLSAAIAPRIVVQGHRQLLAQALANLLDNAVKFTPSGGRIALRLARHEREIVLSLADSGPGVPAADRDRVLQRFVRLDASRGTPGSGLGLSLVAAVAKLHGARLELSDNAPGLKVILSFPM
jgi:signal transduction histidine kinase